MYKQCFGLFIKNQFVGLITANDNYCDDKFVVGVPLQDRLLYNLRHLPRPYSITKMQDIGNLTDKMSEIIDKVSYLA